MTRFHWFMIQYMVKDKLLRAKESEQATTGI